MYIINRRTDEDSGVKVIEVMKCDFIKTYDSKELENILWVNSLQGHKFTVLSRRTGFSDSHIDIETGYRDLNDKFWLASGNFDIRNYLPLSINEAILLIKENANTCVGI